MSVLMGLSRGLKANYYAFFGMLLFHFPALLGYNGADVRTERFRSTPMSALKGFGWGLHTNYCDVLGTHIFYCPPSLITEVPMSGPNGFVQYLYKLLRAQAGDRMQTIIFFRHATFPLPVLS